MDLTELESFLGFNISENDLFNILFEMNHYFDSDFINLLKSRDFENFHFNQNERNNIRKYFYYGESFFIDSIKNIPTIPTIKPSLKDKENVKKSFISRCNTYGKDKIISSILEKYNILKSKKCLDNSSEWLKYFDNKRKNNSDFSLFIMHYNQDNFIKDNFNIVNIFNTIKDIYDHLENYRYFIFHLNGKLLDKLNRDVTWKVLYKVGIFSENFIQFNKEYIPFKRDKKIQELNSFLLERFNKSDIKGISEDFYKNISTGFKFEDCLISDNQNNIILTFRKIKLDQSPVPCPICMSTKQCSNAYPEVFLRSYECKNPNCSERSKSGRGKRFDEYGAYRFFKLMEDSPNNHIQDELYSKWRRDIFSDTNDIYEMLLKYYSYEGETVCLNEISDMNKYSSLNRSILIYEPYKDNKYIIEYEELPIVKLFNNINSLIPNITGLDDIKESIKVINDNSKNISKLKPNQIGSVITSPPYYNAREYSHWSNMVLYFIDMMINCKNIYNTLFNEGYYLYNIGDIVGTDNVYISTISSKRRLPLGFLSCMIFEMVGFNLVGNKIWDKGEVQSKRNATLNRNTGYVKCINCYEHVFVFKKGFSDKNESSVERINPVIKINSKGENNYGHTAPYPLDIVSLIEPYIQKNKYILDPFLGSGTTAKWCKEKGYKFIGYELDKNYFELIKKNLI